MLENEYGLNAGLNRRRGGFFKKFSFRNFVKLNQALIAPHTLMNKKDRGRAFGIIKKATQFGLAPHTLMNKKDRGRAFGIVKKATQFGLAPHTFIKRNNNISNFKL
jgi:hypothetical protein